jgi:hypothetical protein
LESSDGSSNHRRIAIARGARQERGEVISGQNGGLERVGRISQPTSQGISEQTT